MGQTMAGREKKKSKQVTADKNPAEGRASRVLHATLNWLMP